MKDLEDDIYEYQDIDDISSFSVRDIVVYSRDWTIETIYNQIVQGNIDLTPDFQRRNAWKDAKRSKLIESILLGFPIPEIVLAESTQKKGSFIVIDGKQRLLTIAGFINNDTFRYWDIPRLQGLNNHVDLCGYTYNTLIQSPDLKRAFQNSSLRCTVITNYNSDEVLYDIFYRLNSGATPLSTQELRQVLNKGDYSNYLISLTANAQSPIDKVMGLTEPDKRLRDVETVLRLMAFIEYAQDYNGNLRAFLDDKMAEFNRRWSAENSEIEALYGSIIETISLLASVFGDITQVGRRFKDGKFEKRFNRVILEVEVFFFRHIRQLNISNKSNKKFVEGFKDLCDNDYSFRASIEGSTKNMENYRIRYSAFQKLVNESYSVNLNINPYAAK